MLTVIFSALSFVSFPSLSFCPFTVERYNPQENRWHTVSPMGTRRKHLGCAVYQDMIYSVGGRDDTTELSSAERYNPRTNQWSPVVAMTSRRSGVCVFVCLCVCPCSSELCYKRCSCWNLPLWNGTTILPSHVISWCWWCLRYDWTLHCDVLHCSDFSCVNPVLSQHLLPFIGWRKDSVVANACK